MVGSREITSARTGADRTSDSLLTRKFEEPRKAEVQLLRIILPRTPVNRGRNRCVLATYRVAFPEHERLYFVDQRQQIFQCRVEPLPAPPA